jgi:hypothetical protein
VDEGNLCDPNHCSCTFAAISSRVAAQYAADYAKKFDGVRGAGCSCPGDLSRVQQRRLPGFDFLTSAEARTSQTVGNPCR